MANQDIALAVERPLQADVLVVKNELQVFAATIASRRIKDHLPTPSLPSWAPRPDAQSPFGCRVLTPPDLSARHGFGEPSLPSSKTGMPWTVAQSLLCRDQFS
jgi:hypothetical protein